MIRRVWSGSRSCNLALQRPGVVGWYSYMTPPWVLLWWLGAQSLVVADEMRHLRSYLGPLDHLIGAVVHLVTVDYYE